MSDIRYIENKKSKVVRLSLMLIFVLLTLSVVGFSHTFEDVNAQTGLPIADATNNTVFVAGSALSHIKPDQVTVSFGIETINRTAQKALTSNSDLMNKVLNALKSQGVLQNETSTFSFTINPVYNYSSDNSQGRLIGFSVSNSIQIESKNIESVSKWIDNAVSSGANNVNDVQFSLSDKRLDEIKNSLLAEAVGNAKVKADIVADAVGMKVIGVKSIIADDVTSIPPTPIYRAEALTPSAGASTPIISGQQDVTATVNVIYLLGK